MSQLKQLRHCLRQQTVATYLLAVERLFSQLKFISHGDLLATRYSQALASLITRGSIHGKPVAEKCFDSAAIKP